MHIERNREIIGVALQELEQHAEKPVQAAGRRTVRRPHVRQGIKRTEQKAVPVNCNHLLHGFT